jgi:AcrR family transcriptional regulator
MQDRPSRRELQAEQTRRDIVAAARELFSRQGYAKTSVAQIAEAAGVSVQTIYDSLGSKRAIVQQLNDYIDEVGGVASLVEQIEEERDPARVIRLVVMLSRQINERCEDLVRLVWGAAAVEPELAAVRDESIRRHREGVRGVTGMLAGIGALAEHLTVTEAADIIGSLTTPQVARTFVFDFGWTFDHWEEWTAETLCGLVLRRPGPD